MTGPAMVWALPHLAVISSTTSCRRHSRSRMRDCTIDTGISSTRIRPPMTTSLTVRDRLTRLVALRKVSFTFILFSSGYRWTLPEPRGRRYVLETTQAIRSDDERKMKRK
jgi:hypothetical protein